MSKTIVVASHGDDGPTRDALALGITLAQALDGQLILAGMWASPLGPGDGLYAVTVGGRIEEELAALKKRVPAGIFTTTATGGATSIVRSLHKLAAKRHADILVVGPSHLSTTARAFRGNIALGAAHDAPCAVAVAPAGLRDEGPAGNGVVLAWDDSPEARLALETAVELAQRTGGTLHVVYVLETPYRYAESFIPPTEMTAWETEVTGYGEDALDRAESLVAGRVPTTVELREGLASEQLVAAAEGHAFLVAGSRGYGPLKRLVLGSTTSQVLEHATVPVLLVPRGAEDDDEAAQPAARSKAGQVG